MSARWAPYKRADEPVRSCLLVQAASRSRQDGVPCSSTLKGELGVAWGVPPAFPRAGASSSHWLPGLGWGALLWCQRRGLSVALLYQPMCHWSWRPWSRRSRSAWR